MKLLFISGDTGLAQGKKGPFYYLLEEFSKYWERIDIICPKTKQRISNVHKNVYIHGFSWPMWRQPWFILKKGLEIYKKEKFDIFGIHDDPPFYNDIGGYWLHKKTRAPYVLEAMHIAGDPKAGNLKEWIYKILSKLFIRYFARKAKAVRVINKKQTPEFLKKAGIDEKKIKVVPAFYIDFNIFKPLDFARGKPKKYDIVFSGRLVKNKGIMLLLSAIEKSKIQNPNIKLIIIGDGPLRSKIQKFIKKNRLENNVEFAGWLPTIKDVAKIYNQSKMMVMPSFNEGGPRVTLEAMACKVPVITSKVGVMIDIIKHPAVAGQVPNGLFIDWDVKDIKDKILSLLNNENLRKKIAENGYKTIQQFERKKAIKNYAQFYKNLLYNS